MPPENDAGDPSSPPSEARAPSVSARERMPTMLAEADTYPRGSVVAGRYELADVVSSGASSSVLRARDRRTGFPVAVKLVSSLRGAVEDARRVALEATALGKIASRHVVSAHDHGVDPSYGAFLVLDLVEGSPLGPELLGRPFFPHEVLRAARGLLSGLAAAHGAGVVHHDVRPANVIVPGDRLESAVLVDFDVSNVAVGADEDVWGTRRYSAPERLEGRMGDTRSDVFSAGMLLYELLGLPLLRDGVNEAEGLAVPLGLVPKPLSTVLERMVAVEPSRRFATASDALAVVLDLDTAPIEDGVDPRVAPASVRSSPPKASTAGFPRLFRLADDPAIALRECLAALDTVLLDALVRREPTFVAAKVAREALGLGLRAAHVHARASAETAPFVAAFLSARAERSLAASPDADFDAVDPETHAMLATFCALLATPGTARHALPVVRRASARLRDDAQAAKTVLTTLHVAEVALSVFCEDRPARSAIADVRAAIAKETPKAGPSPLDRVTRGLLLGAIALHEDPELSRVELEGAAAIALEAKCALLEARVLSELGRLACSDSATRELGLGWLVRVEVLSAHGEAPTFAHASHHDRGEAALLRGFFEEAAREYTMARAVIADEGRMDELVLSSAGLVLAELAMGMLDRASSIAAELVEPRLATCEARTAAHALVARAMVALTQGDLARARRDVERAKGYAVRVVRGSRDAVGLVEVTDALLHVEGLPEPEGVPRRNLIEIVFVHTGGALRFVPILRAIASRVSVASIRGPIIAAAEAALREVGPPPSGERITQPPPAP